ncbi:phage head-tail adaptor, putative, SPP1 family [Paenibacillus sp. UNCCL117]|uniref:phage head closure protein n=1 Tax=unclassified Paenibacillus TaxID=185978 RepID=UPI00088CD87B|nr:MULTISPECIES: phage head closure protein [unclassified Paenibacillus]SDC69878.1 phage head-tail adaptor, putative, SPP1 family [Paenibacillus sp. cl123]SFW24054.1 phage head-tail adaptor, putative, SPP1 family [Paenibacillus sp. UNCCL117]
MTYDHEVTLIGQVGYESDENGNQIPQENDTTILCSLKSIGRNEFYNAAAAGLRPELTFTVHAYEYNGERTLQFEGQLYRIIRTYSTGIEELELVCERVAADG